MSGIPPGMNPIAIGNGGTNASTAPEALANLGAIGSHSPTFTGTITAEAANFSGAVAFTGLGPTAPTAPPGTNTTQLATTAFVKEQNYGVGTITGVTAGAGLTGGGTSGTVSLALAAGANPNVGTFQGLTLDTYGRVTGAVNQNYLTASTGVASFNTRTGPVTLSSADVTSALTYTPYNATNPSNYQTAAQVSAVLPLASTTNPAMNGTVAVGTGTTWARADHVHASDTSRAPLASPTFTGAVTAPAGTTLKIDASGNTTVSGTFTVGNNANPTLTITGTTYTGLFGPDGAANSGVEILLGNATTPNNWYDNTNHVFRARSAGANMAMFTATGTTNVSGSWLTFSDRRLKTDIAPWDCGLEVICQLKPVSFHYTENCPFHTERRLYGLVADEVAEVLPEIVGESVYQRGVDATQETAQTLEPGQLTYVLINAVKELAAQNAALEARIAALEARMSQP